MRNPPWSVIMITRRETGTFGATDQYGNPHLITILTTFRTVMQTDLLLNVPTTTDFALEDGTLLHRLAKGAYEDVDVGTRYASDDPNAP
jgi:hypothetical protein